MATDNIHFPVKSQYAPLSGTTLYRAMFALQSTSMMSFIDSMASPFMTLALAKELNCGATII